MVICRKNPARRFVPPPPPSATAHAGHSDAGPVFVPRRRLSPFAEALLERSRGRNERMIPVAAI